MLSRFIRLTSDLFHVASWRREGRRRIGREKSIWCVEEVSRPRSTAYDATDATNRGRWMEVGACPMWHRRCLFITLRAAMGQGGVRIGAG